MARTKHLAAVIILALVSTAYSQTVHTDQANTPATRSWFWLNAACPTVQEFIPTNSWINFIDLHFKGEEQYSTLVWVNILQGTNVISVLGFGSGAMLQDTQDHFVRCYLDSTLELNPGGVYAISVERLDDRAGVAVAADNTGGYHRGRLTANGAPVKGYSLWFREGYVESPAERFVKTLSGDRKLRLSIETCPQWTTIHVTAGTPASPSPNPIAYKLQYSDDLASWNDAPGPGASTYADGSTVTFFDMGSWRSPHRLYRAVDITSNARLVGLPIWRHPFSGSAPAQPSK
jgi:hypothetical protein